MMGMMGTTTKKFLSLGLAVTTMLGFTACTIKTPATVGKIGEIEIPAGVYLAEQYNAYTDASGKATLATGETAGDVKAVLKADVTGKIGDKDVTENGKQYVADLTLHNLEYYAAVESRFAELGGTLEDAATAEAASTVDSDWTNKSATYEANGISKASLLNIQLNAQKAKQITGLLYGKDGTQPITDAEYRDYIQNDCLYLDTVVLPLFDSTTYVFADDTQKAAIQALAQQCAEAMNKAATPEAALSDVYNAMYEAATAYVPQAYQALGVTTFDATQAYYYVGSQLYTAKQLSGYDDGSGNNTLKDAAATMESGTWGTVDLGTSIVVFRTVDPFQNSTLDDLVSQNDLVTAMKGDEVESMLYEEGAAMEHALNAGAMNTYKAANIRYSVS